MTTTSAPLSQPPCACRGWTLHPHRLRRAVGSSVASARSTRTSGVPSVVRPWISERATRECRTSPTIATVSLRQVAACNGGSCTEVEQALRRVRMTAVAGVDRRGRASRPVAVEMRRDEMRRAGTARGGRRTCRRSSPPGCRRCRAASRPLLVDDTPMLRLITSADRRFAAISKVVRVRVEFSKNRLNTELCPRSNGTFFTSRSEIDAKGTRRCRGCGR